MIRGNIDMYCKLYMFMKQERPEINDVLRKKKHLVVKKNQYFKKIVGKMFLTNTCP